MKTHIGIYVLLSFTLLAACSGNGTQKPVVVTATTAPTIAATVDVNAVQTRVAANIFATQTAFAPTPVLRTGATQTSPDLAATETAVASGSTSNSSGGPPPAPAAIPAVPTATIEPGAIAPPTATIESGANIPPPAAATATPTPQTLLPTRTSAPSLPPGVYVTKLRTNPAQPKQTEVVTFIATFVNTTGAPQNYNWLVEIYDANTNKGIGETAVQSVSVPVGTHEIASASNWKWGLGPCQSLYAQAQYQNQDKTRHPFAASGGSVLSYSFQVCPS